VIKNRINKKKTSVYSIIRSTVLIAFIVVLFFIFFDIYKSNTIKKVFANNIEKFSKNYGYSFTKVNINKLINVKPEEIEKYFTKYYGNSIFLIPIEEISKNLYQNKWIKDFTIKNDFKNTININIVESIPIGIYFNDEDNFLFGKNGEIIDSVNSNFNLYFHLIRFEGNNSLLNANTFLNSLPLLFQNEIKKAIFINNRRWDIILRNGINLKLAENNILDSFNNYDKFYKSISNQDLREIEVIDLRVPKKVIIKFIVKNND
jgi:cell division septal protein FtsQ